MAKKNSTKTATKEAMAASEPRVMTIKGWKGINLSTKPEGWVPEDDEPGQTDLTSNYFMVQDNVMSCPTGSIETRPGFVKIGNAPVCTDRYTQDGEIITNRYPSKFTGLSTMNGKYIFAGLEYTDTRILEDPNKSPDEDGVRQTIAFAPIMGSNTMLNDKDGKNWQRIHFGFKKSESDITDYTKPPNVKWKSVGFYCVDGDQRMVAMGYDRNKQRDVIYSTHKGWVKNIDVDKGVFPGIVEANYVGNPTIDHDYTDTSGNKMFKVRPVGNIATPPEATASEDISPASTLDQEQAPIGDQEASTNNMTFWFSYTNEYGSTLVCDDDLSLSVTTYMSMMDWDYDNYLLFSGRVPYTASRHDHPDFWHKRTIKNPDGTDKVVHRTNATGVDIYYTMNNYTYPVYVGHALINQETGNWSYKFYGVLNSTLDWGAQNTELPDANTTSGPDAKFMTQIDGRLYFYGCTAHPERLYIGGNAGHELSIARGFGGAFVDIDPGTGLEIKGVHKFKTHSGSSIVTILCSNRNSGKTKRFNLIESSISLSQESSEKTYIVEEVENVVGCSSFYGSGVWEDGMYYLDRYGLAVTTQQMEYSSQLRSTFVSSAIEPIFTDRVANSMDNARLVYINGKMYMALANENGDELERIIFVYDMSLKTWYTISLPQWSDEKIIHIMSFDYRGWKEGLGIFTENNIYMLPTVMQDDYRDFDNFTSHVESGEISTTMPPTSTSYICQLEFNFDWFIGHMTIELEGVDYYGRHVKVVKEINEDQVIRNYQVWMRVDQKMRSYNLTMKGMCRYKLVCIAPKIYLQSRKVNLVYGFDDSISYRNRRGATQFVHRKVDSYNNLRECILP